MRLAIPSLLIALTMAVIGAGCVKKVQPAENFTFAGTLQCKVVNSWGNFFKDGVGSLYVVTQLMENEPVIKFPSGASYVYSVRNENEDTITLEDIDTGIFTINKTDGTFATTIATADNTLGASAGAQTGYCW